MTPERAQFHILMLEAGEHGLLERELSTALEEENPLSGLTLALSLCGDEAETLHTLREYLLDHPADKAEVESMVRQELRSRLERGEVSPETCLQLMHSIACNISDGKSLDLYVDVCVVEEYRDQAADGIIAEETYLLCLDALMKAEPIPDVWQLDREIRRAKRRGQPYPGENHPGVLTIPDVSTESTPNQRRTHPMRKFLRKFIGDKAFYRAVMVILLPLVVQQGITSFVSLLDNLMVGTLGPESFGAVGVVNQILMVFNLTIFGGLSGVSIFGAQYAGKGDVDGMRQSFRTKLYFGAAVLMIGTGVLLAFGENFIQLFLQGESNTPESAALTLSEGLSYLKVMLWGLPPFVIAQAYVGSMRELGRTVATMVGSIIAIMTNLVLNFLLIYEVRELTVFGFTFTMWGADMGVRGAALATVIARYVECVFVTVYAHAHQGRYVFLKGAYRNGYVPLALLGRIVVTGSPLLLNEVLWSLGMAFINQCYSTRSLSALNALNITSTAWNLFCIIMFAMGNAVSIMVGQYLGRGDKKGARDVDTKLLFLTVVSHIVLGGALMLCAGVIPQLFDVGEEAKALASRMLLIAGLSLPIHAFLHATYFTIRSGGKTFITFLFDSVYTWCVPAVLAYVLSRKTDMGVVGMYFCIQFIDVVKLVIGLLMLRSDFWANNVVDVKD